MTLAYGQPIWFELATPDRDAAAAFYRDVVGWTTHASPVDDHGGYILAAAEDGHSVAGMMNPPPGAAADGGWSVYFGSLDITATLATAAKLGATIVFGPMEVPQVGQIAILRDPQGVMLRVMQPFGDAPAVMPFRQAPDAQGHAVWIELATPDPDGAFAFYGTLFGWAKAGAMPMGEMGEYAFFDAGDIRPGAIMSSTLTRAPVQWNSYFLVPDIDAAIATAERSGGKLIQGPDQIPGGDYSVNIIDVHGHQIGLVGPRKDTLA